MSLTGPEIVTLAVVVFFQLLAGAWVLWDMGRDLGWLYDENVALKARVDHLEERVADVIDWLWESSGEQRPPDEPKTAPIEIAPPTVPSHPADTYARKASTLARATYIGQHRA